MIYQYDQAIQLPTKDLYDTQVMQMAIAAAKDMYEKGEKRINDFYEKYQDFYSPIPGATEMVYNEGAGKIKNLINEIYTNGGDPLRTVEGRAKIAQAIRSVNLAKINQAKRDAEFAKQYVIARGKAIADGTYDEDFERWRLGGKTLEEWDPNTPWTETAPGKFVTPDEIIKPVAEGIDPVFDAALTSSMHDGYDYSTVSRDRLSKVIEDNLDNLITKSSAGGYYYNKALKAAGNDPNKAKQLLKEWYLNSGEKYTKQSREVNKYKYDDYSTKNDMKRQSALASLNYRYKQLEKWDFDGDGKISPEESAIKKEYTQAQIEKMRNSIRSKDTNLPDVFNDPDPNFTEYGTDSEYDQGITPNSGLVTRAGGSSGIYDIQESDIQSLLDSGDLVGSDGKPIGLTRISSGELDGNSTITFRSSGRLRKKRVADRDGVHRHWEYFIDGTLWQPSGKVDSNGSPILKQITDGEGKPESFRLKVKPRLANYGKQQKGDKKTHPDRIEFIE